MCMSPVNDFFSVERVHSIIPRRKRGSAWKNHQCNFTSSSTRASMCIVGERLLIVELGSVTERKRIEWKVSLYVFCSHRLEL